LHSWYPAFKNPPFRIQEEGWGEFDMQIELVADKSHFINHDLNFAQERYESKHVLVCFNKSPTWKLLPLKIANRGDSGTIDIQKPQGELPFGSA
jgi:transcription initiation factor IIF auxiliary subunit